MSQQKAHVLNKFRKIIMKSLKILIVSLAFFSCLTAAGQREQSRIYRITGVGELIYPPLTERSNITKVLEDVARLLLSVQNTKRQPQYAEAARTSLKNGLSKAIPFRPLDGVVSMSDLADSTPSFFIDGTIANISIVFKTENTKDSKGKKHTGTSYRSNGSVTVNLNNPADGSVTDNRTFTIQDCNLYRMTSGEKAMTNVPERLTSKIADYYNYLFPLHTSINEKDVSKKNKQKDVYTDLVASDGANNGQQPDVFTVKTIARKEARTIGRLKIEEVEGDEISLCKVPKGSDKIKLRSVRDKTLWLSAGKPVKSNQLN